MPIVIFLIGIAAGRRHHSQVRMHPWTTFFNGSCASKRPLPSEVANRQARKQ